MEAIALTIVTSVNKRLTEGQKPLGFLSGAQLSSDSGRRPLSAELGMALGGQSGGPWTVSTSPDNLLLK